VFYSVLKNHLPALAIIVALALISIVSLPHLPEKVPSFFNDNEGGQNFEPKEGLIAFYFIFSLVLFFLWLLIDLLFIYPVVPGKMFSALNISLQAIFGILHLTSVVLGLGLIGRPKTFLVTGFGALAMICIVRYFKAYKALNEKAEPLRVARYFEEVRPSVFFYIMFPALFFMPRFIVVTHGGLRIMGVLFDVIYPFDQIAEVKPTHWYSPGANMNLYTSFSRLVIVRLKTKRTKIIISPKNHEDFLKAFPSNQ